MLRNRPKVLHLLRRRSLWAEHLGDCADPAYRDPASLECVRVVRRIADANWEAYVQEKDVPMQGHLMMWPYRYHKDGSVTQLIKKFPMTKDPVMGKKHPILAPKLMSG